MTIDCGSDTPHPIFTAEERTIRITYRDRYERELVSRETVFCLRTFSGDGVGEVIDVDEVGRLRPRKGLFFSTFVRRRLVPFERVDVYAVCPRPPDPVKTEMLKEPRTIVIMLVQPFVFSLCIPFDKSVGVIFTVVQYLPFCVTRTRFVPPFRRIVR